MIDELAFDVEDHAYTLRGKLLPNVTRVIASQFPLRVPPHLLEFARQRGRAIHSACELHDKGVLDIAALDPLLVPYLEAWIRFKKETGCEVLTIEERVYHPILKYAGTLDRIAMIYGDCTVLDLKRPVLNARVGVQTAAYEYAHNAMRRAKILRGEAVRMIKRRCGVQLRDDATYRLRFYDDNTDLSAFIASLNLYNWRQTHGE